MKPWIEVEMIVKFQGEKFYRIYAKEESTYDVQNPVATKKWSFCPNDIYITNISLYVLSRPELNFGCHLTFSLETR